MTPLSLTGTQLNFILNGSERVHPWFRHRFLNDVADQLLATPGFTDIDVEKAVLSTSSRMGVCRCG